MNQSEPFARLPQVPSFTVTSTTIATSGEIPLAQRSAIFGVGGGGDVSPELAWSGAPAATQSYVVTMLDVDAATGSGFWHWVVKDIPASTDSLPEGAGNPGSSTLPAGAVQLPGDAGEARYIGAAPPPGDGPHHYWVTVWALDVPRVGVSENASAALLVNTMTPHVIARANVVFIASS